MENADGRELLENVTISDVGGSQYMIQRMAVDSPHLLTTELLQNHNGLVVDLGAGDFIPVNYTSEDLLSQDLTEEDRNLAAALVAVQLSQQQKQQQLQQDSSVIINTSLPSLVTTSSLENSKVSLNDQQLILTDKSSINGGYIQIVEADGIYKHSLSKLSLDSREFNTHSVYDRNQDLDLIKTEDDLDSSIHPRDSDGENKSDNRSSKKSLPHKKRISRKLKKNVSTPRKAYKCNLCEQIFNNNDDFGAHQTLCQTTITPILQNCFSCQLCNAGFHDQLRFFEHLKAHYEPNVVIQPNNSSEPVKTIEYANKTDTLLASLLTTCMQCNKTFRRQKAYEAHVREFHNKQELNEFSESDDIMAGIDVQDTVQSTVDDSKAWYHPDDELHATEEDLRELEAQEHICNNCKQPFPLRAILIQHLMTCKPDTRNAPKETPPPTETKTKKTKKKVNEYRCTQCERVFSHKNSLVYHMRGHLGHRPHICEQCGKSFFAASALKVHLRLHSGDKPYKCEYCGRFFRQWGDLKYHCISIHSDQKQYQCEYCGKNFARKYSLIVHRRIHTGEKNYKCEFCGKTFRASSYLQNHRRIHTGEKPHPCELCGKRFRVRSDMKRHLGTHGRKRVSRGMNIQSDLIVTKVEHTESILPDDEDLGDDTKFKGSESNPDEQLQYDQDTLNSVRDGSTLYVMPILIT